MNGQASRTIFSDRPRSISNFSPTTISCRNRRRIDSDSNLPCDIQNRLTRALLSPWLGAAFASFRLPKRFLFFNVFDFLFA
jgi:hypothetical protein